MASAATVSLSRNDTSVLGALFDPEVSLKNHARIGSATSSPYEPSLLSTIRSEEIVGLRLINTEQPNVADIKEAITKFDSLIETYPKYASAWNNRAQARRLLYDSEMIDNKLELLRGSFSDLAQAIKLASPNKMLQMVSRDEANILASAHTHRGYLLWRASRSKSWKADLYGVEGLCGLTEDQLEEMASREFSLGGKYGNQTAQQLAVKTNPYAKLCGSIVREAMQKEIKDFQQNQA